MNDVIIADHANGISSNLAKLAAAYDSKCSLIFGILKNNFGDTISDVELNIVDYTRFCVQRRIVSMPDSCLDTGEIRLKFTIELWWNENYYDLICVVAKEYLDEFEGLTETLVYACSLEDIEVLTRDSIALKNVNTVVGATFVDSILIEDLSDDVRVSLFNSKNECVLVENWSGLIEDVEKLI